MGNQIEIVPGVWDCVADCWLSKTREIGYTLDQLFDDVCGHRAALFDVFMRGERRAVIVLSPISDAVEIWAFAGSVGGLPGICAVLGEVERIAAHFGFKRVWLQTARPGLARWVSSCGYQVIEHDGQIVELEKRTDEK